MEIVCGRWEKDRGWTIPLADLDSPETLVMAFAPSVLGPAEHALRELRESYPRATLVGCSTAGEILGETVADDSVTVAIVRFGQARVRGAAVPVGDAEESRAVGASLARELLAAEPGLRAIFVLSDGLTVNGSSLVAGLRDAVGGETVLLTGGLAGDGNRFDTTWVLVDGEPRSGWVSAVGLYGESLELGHGCRGGWDIFGPERRITRSAGNVLHELDGQPALALYKNYLGDRAEGLPATALLFPLALRDPTDSTERQVVRTILAVDEGAQTMTFAGDIPEGWMAQLMRANFDRLVDGARDAALASNTLAANGEPTLAIAVSCVGRRLVLGQRAEDELEATVSGLPHGAQMVGFYSYGELSPGGDGTCDLHNQTMTLTTVRERTPSTIVR